MNLATTVDRFMTMQFTDPYTVGASLYGAIRPYAEGVNSSLSTRRRVLETAADTTMFADRVLSFDGDHYVAGTDNPDVHRGVVLRRKYPILPGTSTARAGSTLQTITAAIPSRSIYSYLHFVRGSVYDYESSDVRSGFDLYHSSVESFGKGSIVFISPQYYRVKNVPYIDGVGFRVAELQLVEGGLQTLSYVRATGYDPMTDTITAGTTTSVSALVEAAVTYYDHSSERHAQIEPGDMNITFKPTVTPRAGETVGGYSILAVDVDESGCFSCHCRVS